MICCLRFWVDVKLPFCLGNFLGTAAHFSTQDRFWWARIWFSYWVWWSWPSIWVRFCTSSAIPPSSLATSPQRAWVSCFSRDWGTVFSFSANPCSFYQSSFCFRWASSAHFCTRAPTSWSPLCRVWVFEKGRFMDPRRVDAGAAICCDWCRKWWGVFGWPEWKRCSACFCQPSPFYYHYQ